MMFPTEIEIAAIYPASLWRHLLTFGPWWIYPRAFVSTIVTISKNLWVKRTSKAPVWPV